MNAIALSLNKASLGLPIDPTNGVGDIERKELRAIHNYAFYDDPSRMLRLIRFKVRLDYTIDERTRLQYENAREAEMLTRITPEALGAELRHIAAEPLAGDLMKALEDEKLIGALFAGAGRSEAESGDLRETAEGAPDCAGRLPDSRHAVVPGDAVRKTKRQGADGADQASGLTKAEVNAAQKIDAAAGKLERILKGAKLKKTSQLYQVLVKAPGELVLYLMVYSDQRLVQDRIKNYFQKYLPLSLEITDEMVAATGVAPGTPKFARAKEEMILTRLDARPKKPPPEPEPPPPPPMSSFARGPGPRAPR